MVRIYGACLEAPLTCIVMELLPSSLKQVLQPRVIGAGAGAGVGVSTAAQQHAKAGAAPPTLASIATSGGAGAASQQDAGAAAAGASIHAAGDSAGSGLGGSRGHARAAGPLSNGSNTGEGAKQLQQLDKEAQAPQPPSSSSPPPDAFDPSLPIPPRTPSLPLQPRSGDVALAMDLARATPGLKPAAAHRRAARRGSTGELLARHAQRQASKSSLMPPAALDSAVGLGGSVPLLGPAGSGLGPLSALQPAADSFGPSSAGGQRQPQQPLGGGGGGSRVRRASSSVAAAAAGGAPPLTVARLLQVWIGRWLVSGTGRLRAVRRRQQR